ncbi:MULTISPECIES: hypothetical protein [Lactobacillus]|uniref:Surface layer protein A domain-containing protein n=1 Tax=Lactobacillus xujianguonis TaxID=2495899 RepID=A0A437SUL8_9LACO|nr:MULTISPECIES: hypothetical protein [Lactobacillus]RVU70572.1 hypothetical protein EJK17_06685 [Lactobacillus xujianguonis]RVU73803.1 hypothetical protein EJK20_06365 [Lactobacillus xujianguonis]
MKKVKYISIVSAALLAVSPVVASSFNSAESHVEAKTVRKAKKTKKRKSSKRIKNHFTYAKAFGKHSKDPMIEKYQKFLLKKMNQQYHKNKQDNLMYIAKKNTKQYYLDEVEENEDAFDAISADKIKKGDEDTLGPELYEFKKGDLYVTKGSSIFKPEGTRIYRAPKNMDNDYFYVDRSGDYVYYLNVKDVKVALYKD